MSSNNQKSESSKEGWVKVRFDQMAENIADHIDIPSKSGYERFVGGDHLDSECLRIKRWGSTNDVDAQKLLFKKGHILFGKRNAYLRKVAYADFDGVCSAHMMVLKMKTEFVDERFFPFFMQTDQFWDRADMISEGSMSPTIKWKTLAKQEFIIPPKNKQRRIADILWAAEDYIVKSEKLADETELYKKILMNELFIKGIGHKVFRDTEIGRIPMEWEVVMLGDEKYFTIVSGGTPDTNNKSYWENGNIFWATPTDITSLKNILIKETHRKISKKGLENSSAKLLPIGTVLMTSRATIGEVCINEIPMCTNQGFQSFICMDKVNNIFLLNSLKFNKNRINRLGGKSTFMEVTKSSLRTFKISLPPLPEQLRIAEIISKVDDTIHKSLDNINKIKALKKMLINQFFNGGLETAVSINPRAKQLYETQVSE